MKIIKKTTI